MTAHTRFLQPGERGFDTASILTRTVLTAAKADGITWIAKYVPYGTDWSKSKFWHDSEIALCDEFGMARVPIYEVNETRYTGGPTVGKIDGTRGRQALIQQGWPMSVPMFIAIDTDIITDNPRTVIHEGNADIVFPYLAAAFDAQGSARPASYMDSDGARIMLGYNPAVSVPNASWWSQEVYKVRNDPVKRLAVTTAIPGCVMVQFNSGPHYGINIDPCLIVAPLEAWVAPHADPPPQVEVDPPTVAPPLPQPFTTPTGPILEEDTLQYIADSQSKGSALVTFITRADNVADYRMAGISGDVRAMGVEAGLKAVAWPDDIYLLRASQSYRG